MRGPGRYLPNHSAGRSRIQIFGRCLFTFPPDPQCQEHLAISDC